MKIQVCNSISDEILSKIDLKKTVFWVGAGIDVSAPTCLPLGVELLTFVLDYTCGENNRKALYRIFEESEEIVKKNGVSFLYNSKCRE